MPKIPFDYIAPEASRLIKKMTLAKDFEEIDRCWDTYRALVEGAGWTLGEFEAEELRRINQDWDDTKPPIRN